VVLWGGCGVFPTLGIILCILAGLGGLAWLALADVPFW
jgi:hypothetical protein